jgi:hypothetical protein
MTAPLLCREALVARAGPPNRSRLPQITDGMTSAQVRRHAPVFRTASSFCLLLGVVELLRSYPNLPRPVGALPQPADSELVTWIVAVYLAVPLAYAICGVLMLLRGSVAAAVVAVLVALANMIALGVHAIVGPPMAIALPLLHSMLVIVAGVCALAHATLPSRAVNRSAPPAETDGATPARRAGRDKVFLATSAVCLLLGVALWIVWIMYGRVVVGPLMPSDPMGRLQFTVWLLVVGLVRPAAYVISGVLMLLRGSTAAAVVAVLVAVLDVLPFGWHVVVNGFRLSALFGAPFLLVVVTGIWAVVRVTRFRRSRPS